MFISTLIRNRASEIEIKLKWQETTLNKVIQSAPLLQLEEKQRSRHDGRQKNRFGSISQEIWRASMCSGEAYSFTARTNLACYSAAWCARSMCLTCFIGIFRLSAFDIFTCLERTFFFFFIGVVSNRRFILAFVKRLLFGIVFLCWWVSLLFIYVRGIFDSVILGKLKACTGICTPLTNLNINNLFEKCAICTHSTRKLPATLVSEALQHGRFSLSFSNHQFTVARYLK